MPFPRVNAIFLEVGKKLETIDTGGSAQELVDTPCEVEDSDELRIACGGRFSELRAFGFQRFAQSPELRRQAGALAARRRPRYGPKPVRTIPRRNTTGRRGREGEKRPGLS